MVNLISFLVGVVITGIIMLIAPVSVQYNEATVKAAQTACTGNLGVEYLFIYSRGGPAADPYQDFKVICKNKNVVRGAAKLND